MRVPAVVPVIVTWQVPAALSAHVPPPEKVTAPVPDWLQAMVSPVTVPLNPDRVAVHWEVFVMPKVAGMQDTATLGVLTVNVTEPEVGWLLASPG